MKVVVGLGNPGPRYAQTRHNVGFMVLDQILRQCPGPEQREKFAALFYRVFIDEQPLALLKPTTFMNLSGKAVHYWMEQEKIPLENVLVITDDINLPFGTIRLKTKGSDGGHNGLKDIQNILQTTSYNRFRFGVGADFGQGRQIDYVLGEWNEDEKKELPERFEKASALIKSFVLAGVNITMNEFNGT